MKRNFLLCGLLGWSLEIFWTGLHSLFKRDRQLMGHSSLWMFPIYGSAAFLAPLMRILQKNCIWKRGLIYMLCIYLGEYISGRLLKNKDMCPWDYSDCPLQYQGVIRFDFAPLWFLTGLLFERVILYRSSNQDSEFSQN